MNPLTATGAALYVAWGITAASVLGWRLSNRLLPAPDPPARVFLAGITALIGLELELQILGATHLLYSWVAVLIELIGAIAAIKLTPVPRPLTRLKLGGRQIFLVGTLVVVAATAVAVSLNGPSLEFDTRRYHIVNAATWLNNHQTWTLPYAQPGDHTAADPGNAELLGTWAMLPTHDDSLAYVGNAIFTGLIILGAAVWARRRTRHWGLYATAALALLCGVEVLPSQLHSLTGDLLVTLSILAALLLYDMVRDQPTPGAVFLLGTSLGLASGAKYAGLLMTVGLLLVVAVRRQRRWLVWGIPGTVMLSGFWFVRNLVDTGNPIYPQQVSIAGHVLLTGSSTKLSASGSLLGHIVTPNVTALTNWLGTVGLILGPLAILVVLGAAGKWRPPTRRFWVAGAICFCAYISLPYTGGASGDVFDLAAPMRYFIPAALIFVLLGIEILPWRIAATFVGLGLLYDFVELVKLPGRPDLVPPLAMTAVAVLVLAQIAAAWLMASSMRTLWGTTTAAGLTVLLLMAPRPQQNSVTAALSGHGTVAVIAVADVRTVMGPTFDNQIVSVGAGDTEGARSPLTSAAAINQTLATLHVTRLALGDDKTDLPLPPVSLPQTWHVVTSQPGLTVYENENYENRAG